MGRSKVMTEDLWLKSRDIKRMFARLGKPTELVQDPCFRRKSRLFGVAAISHSWRELELPEVVYRALEVAERFADNHATAAEMQASKLAVLRTRSLGEFGLAPSCVTHDDPTFTGLDAATHAYVQLDSRDRWDAHVANSMAHAHLLRDIFGNPFRPVNFNPDWRTSTAVALAQGMYDSRDFSAMPILADALEDTGCSSDDILRHCREPQATHVRGCWVVDLVLGKV